MKKLIIPLILSIFFFAGCAEDTIGMKEKCSKYLKQATDRVDRLNSDASGVIIYIHEGTFYSKKENSCVTKIIELSAFEERTTFHDELTGRDLVSYPIPNESTAEQKEIFKSLIDKFDKELQLVY